MSGRKHALLRVNRSDSRILVLLSIFNRKHLVYHHEGGFSLQVPFCGYVLLN